jgi:hypothetical protein
MEKVRFAFYKAQKGDFFGHAISGYTGFFNWIGSGFKKQPAYSHVEIGMFIDGAWKWYSSESRNDDGTNGTRWIPEEKLFKHPERWDIFEVDAVRSIEDMFITCGLEVGKPYDWSGIVGFVTIFGQVNERSRWYCSEICQYVFTGKWIKRISPIALYGILKDKERI